MSATSLAIEFTQHNRIPSNNVTQNYVEDIVSSSSSQVWIGKEGEEDTYFLLTVVAWTFVTECIVWNRASCRVIFLWDAPWMPSKNFSQNYVEHVVSSSSVCMFAPACACVFVRVVHVCVCCAHPWLAWLHACKHMRMYVPV